MVTNYSPFHGVRYAPRPWDILFSPRGASSPEVVVETRRDVMKLLARSIALAVVFSLVLGGPLAPFARAQQPSQPDVMQDAARSQNNGANSPAYDVGAGIANAAYRSEEHTSELQSHLNLV